MDYKEKIRNAILGSAVGDALGVPVEFIGKETRIIDPVTDMRAYGSHDQPKGTWSDDTSMTLATIDGLASTMGDTPDYGKIMDNFVKWFEDGKFTVDGKVFDWGMTCGDAIRRYEDEGLSPVQCGNTDHKACGNGSLMRIMPMAFWCHALYGSELAKSEAAMDAVQYTSMLTHANFICKIGCLMYVALAMELISGKNKNEAFEKSVRDIFSRYDKMSNFGMQVFRAYLDIADGSLLLFDEKDLKGTGYIVHSLESALWCFMKTDNYRDCVLKAVNLGDDTDTTAAVAGGLAGLYYGIGGEKGIPEEWLTDLRGKDLIFGLCNEFSDRLQSAGAGGC